MMKIKIFPFKIVLYMDLLVESVEVLRVISNEVIEKEKKLPLFTLASYPPGRRYIGKVEKDRFKFYRLFDYGFDGGYLKESKFRQEGLDSISFEGTILNASVLRMEIIIGKMNVFFILTFTGFLIMDMLISGLTVKNSFGLVIIFLFTAFIHFLLYREYVFWKNYLQTKELISAVPVQNLE